MIEIGGHYRYDELLFTIFLTNNKNIKSIILSQKRSLSTLNSLGWDQLLLSRL